jgi:hypothetical protein
MLPPLEYSSAPVVGKSCVISPFTIPLETPVAASADTTGPEAIARATRTRRETHRGDGLRNAIIGNRFMIFSSGGDFF